MLLKKVILNSLVFLISGYRYCISPLFGNCCRFYPSCSEYAEMAIKEHGVCCGLGLTICRLIRCHPFEKGGIDLVPNPRQSGIVEKDSAVKI